MQNSNASDSNIDFDSRREIVEDHWPSGQCKALRPQAKCAAVNVELMGAAGILVPAPKAWVDVLGLVNDDLHTDLFNRNGSYLSLGTPQVRTFIEHDYSLYAGDTYRITHALTLNLGVRYENFRPPYEAHGLQVTSWVNKLQARTRAWR
jgi:hypothetical protein